MRSLLTPDQIVSAPIADGDTGVTLKLDGSFKLFSTSAIGADGFTPDQREQGTRLLALAVALAHPVILEITIRMSRDPKIVGDGIDLGTLH